MLDDGMCDVGLMCNRFGIRGLDVTFGPYTPVNSQGLPWTLANGGSIPHSVLSSLTTSVQPDGPLLLPLPLQPPAATAPHPPPPSLPLRPAAEEPVSSPEEPGSWPELTSPAPTSPYPYPSPNTYPSPSPDPTPSDLTTTFSIIIGVMAGLAVTGLLLCYVAPTCLRSTAAAKDSGLGPHTPHPSPGVSSEAEVQQELRMEQQLGAGAFGTVYRGTWRGMQVSGPGPVRPVAAAAGDS
ncbi:hypothetical protein QJQ45_010466 [Haematococcus lacustris]|nr:hypothetical protein QJQ45_010466 [Haematococcus lacustris]